MPAHVPLNNSDAAPRTIILPNATSGGFDYLCPADVPAGTLAEINMRGRSYIGMITDAHQRGFDASKCKPITRVLDTPAYTKSFRDWLAFVSEFTLAPLGSVLALTGMKIAATLPKKPLSSQAFSPVLPTLSSEQHAAYEATMHATKPVVLHGVTGSGKTEIYFHAIAERLKQNPSAQILVLLPEIGLTHQWLSRFEQAFGAPPACWHSGMNASKKKAVWHGVAQGCARVVVGARSALFLPFANLDLIVVDEEHDSTYKQDDGVLYQARDMAVARAKFEGAAIVLASATPSLETRYNIEQGRYEEVKIGVRHGGATLPDISLIDMRLETLDSGCFISPSLRAAMAETLASGDQVLLFLNRRGYAPLMLCRGCGHRFMCPSCSAWLVLHTHNNTMQCHHCGHREAPPVACPSCGADKEKLVACGPGVERIEEEVRALFPELNNENDIQVFSSDAPPDETGWMGTISGKTRIIIGTQMLAKGHHFPHLTLVGVIDTDMGLSGGDLRASEHTYQLLQQLAGRAGREQKKGRVLLQSYAPENAVIEALHQGNHDAFSAEELEVRRRGSWPPYGSLAAIILDGKNESAVRAAGFALMRCAPVDGRFRVLGPAPAPLSKLKGQYRYRLLVKAARDIHLQRTLRAWLKDTEALSAATKSVRIKIDVNPYYFL